MYDLGVDGQGMSRVAAMSQSSIVAAAGNVARFVSYSSPLVKSRVLMNGSYAQRSSLLKNKSQFISLFFYIAPCRTIDRSVFKPIIEISVIDRSESSDCHLLAVTHAGKETD